MKFVMATKSTVRNSGAVLDSKVVLQNIGPPKD